MFTSRMLLGGGSLDLRHAHSSAITCRPRSSCLVTWLSRSSSTSASTTTWMNEQLPLAVPSSSAKPSSVSSVSYSESSSLCLDQQVGN